MTDLGAWAPFTIDMVVTIMRDVPVRWWLSGGCALERVTTTPIREHDDIDISVARADWDSFATYTASTLECFVASDGTLSPAPTTALPDHARNIWTRERGASTWRLQVNLESVVDDIWFFRRDERVHRPIDEVVLHDGALPYVNPAVQLLWKAKEPLPKDDVDFAAVWPLLSPAERAWLANAVALAHPSSPWRARLSA